MKKKQGKPKKTQWEERLNIYISRSMKDFVERKATRMDTTESGYVRQLLKAEMDKESPTLA